MGRQIEGRRNVLVWSWAVMIGFAGLTVAAAADLPDWSTGGLGVAPFGAVEMRVEGHASLDLDLTAGWIAPGQEGGEVPVAGQVVCVLPGGDFQSGREAEFDVEAVLSVRADEEWTFDDAILGALSTEDLHVIPEPSPWILIVAGILFVLMMVRQWNR